MSLQCKVLINTVRNNFSKNIWIKKHVLRYGRWKFCSGFFSFPLLFPILVYLFLSMPGMILIVFIHFLEGYRAKIWIIWKLHFSKVGVVCFPLILLVNNKSPRVKKWFITQFIFTHTSHKFIIKSVSPAVFQTYLFTFLHIEVFLTER